MATEAAGAACPVCGEGLPERPATCFRCETPLGHWWPLADALEATPTPLAVVEGRPRRALWLPFAALIVGLVAGAAVARSGSQPLAPHAEPIARHVQPPSVPPPLPFAPSPSVVRYRVQRRDSLWRVAAAFTGDGRRWKSLWPEYADNPTRLRPGQVLELPFEAERPTAPIP